MSYVTTLLPSTSGEAARGLGGPASLPLLTGWWDIQLPCVGVRWHEKVWESLPEV